MRIYVAILRRGSVTYYLYAPSPPSCLARISAFTAAWAENRRGNWVQAQLAEYLRIHGERVSTSHFCVVTQSLTIRKLLRSTLNCSYLRIYVSFGWKTDGATNWVQAQLAEYLRIHVSFGWKTDGATNWVQAQLAEYLRIS